MRRFVFLGLLIYALVFAALIMFDGLLLLLVIPLVLAAGFALFFGPFSLDGLTAVRTISAERIIESDPAHVTLTVTNNGPPLEELYIRDLHPREFDVANGDVQVITRLDTGQSITLEYTVSSGRGSYGWQGVLLIAYDRLGIFRRERALIAEGDRGLSVLPGFTRIKRIAIRPRQTRVYAGSIPARVGGSGTEFFSVRRYQPGDSLRRINWRANARHPGDLFTNEYQQERIADVGIILDARRRADIELGGRALFEYGVQAAAALAETFLRDANRVGLLIYGRFLAWTPPGYGKRQRERIMRALAGAHTGESLAFNQLRNLPTRFFPAKSQIVLVSPLLPADPRQLQNLRARGYELLIVSPNPLRFEREHLDDSTVTGTAFRIARIERKLMFNELRGAGIRTINWDVSQPFAGQVAAALARQPAWTRTTGARP